VDRVSGSVGVLSAQVALVVVLGGVAGAGVVLLVFGLTIGARLPSSSIGLAERVRAVVGRLGRRGPLTLGVALVSLVVTGWPVAGLAGAALVLAGPGLFGGARAERREAARIEAVAVWTESLRDTIAGAVGLEQAVLATAATPPPAIAADLRGLASRLRVRTPLPVALRRFADDLDDPSSDLIVATLILNSRLRGPGLRDVLTSLAASARAELEMRGRVSAGRASTRRSVQIVVVVTVLFVFGLVVFNPAYVQPYGTSTGQLVLLVVAGLFAAGFWWLRRLSAFDLPGRFLAAGPADRVAGSAAAVASTTAGSGAGRPV
jgi:Flp pilus assembly protein TadB